MFDSIGKNNIKMKIGIFKQDLLKPLDRLSRIVSNKSALPIMDCVKVEVYGEEAFLTAGNDSTKMTIKTNVTPIIDGNFGFCVDIKSLQETLKKMPDMGLSLEFQEENSNIIIDFNSGEMNLPTFNKDEYPEIGKIEGGGIVIDKAMTDKIDKAFRFSADDELRPVMNGVYFDTKKGNIVASDGHSLYLCDSLPINETVPPFNLTKDAYKAIRGLSDYSIVVDERMAYIKGDGFVVSTRLIDGRYPNYMSIIPNNPIEYIIDRDSLLKAIDRAMLCSSIETSLVRLRFDGNKIYITTQDLDRNKSFNESIVCNGSEVGEVGLKGSLATLCLGSLDTNMIRFTYTDKSRAVVFKPIKDGEHNDPHKELILLMPMMI